MTIWQFIFDLTIFHVHFSGLQYIGFGVIGVAYVIDFVKAVWWDAKIEARKKQERMEKERSKNIVILNLLEQSRKTISD